MEKIGEVRENVTPCIGCEKPAVVVRGNKPWCAEHDPGEEKRADKAESLKGFTHPLA